jgi:hypothetical protein
MAESDVSKSSWQKKPRLRRESAFANISPANQLWRLAVIKNGKQVPEPKRVNSDAKLFHDCRILLPRYR